MFYVYVVYVIITIKGEVVEFVDNYKFLGVHLNSSLDWSDNAEAIHSKGKSMLFFVRRLRSFGVYNRMLQMFYQSVMGSVLFFGITCWGGNNRVHPLNQEITLYWSKRGNDRFIYPAQTHARLSKSFVPTALRQYNETHNGRLARIR